MKFLVNFILVGFVITAAVAFPSAREDLSDEAEIIVVPLQKSHNTRSVDFDNFQGVIDTAGFDEDVFAQPPSSFFGNYNPFVWSFPRFSLDDIFRRISDQVATSWQNIPRPWTSAIPEGKGNTTSTVEIVDGHKLIINETVYTKESDYGKSIIKVRVIDVQPLDGDAPKEANDDGIVSVTEKGVDEAEVLNANVPATDVSKKPTAESTGEDEDYDDEDRDNGKQGSPEELDNTIKTNDIKNIDDQSLEVKTTATSANKTK